MSGPRPSVRPWYVTGERPEPRSKPSASPRAFAPLVPSLDELADTAPALEEASRAAARSARPLPVGGPPPTVIRDLDALFARDGRQRSASPAETSTPPAVDPAHFAQMLLQKVASDFTAPAPVAPAPAMVAPAPSPVAPARPLVVTFVPAPLSPSAMLQTLEVPLPGDDADLAQLVPWYRRLWNRLFSR